MERINAKISTRYYPIKQAILNWNFEKLKGIGKKRVNGNRYAIIELNICRLVDYSDKEKISENYHHTLSDHSYIIWKLSETQFPKHEYEFGKEELIKSAEAVVDLFSIIKEQRLNLVFEFVWAGYSASEIWGKGVVDFAFVNAILSCFDDQLFQQGLEAKKCHPFINGEYQSKYQ